MNRGDLTQLNLQQLSELQALMNSVVLQKCLEIDQEFNDYPNKRCHKKKPKSLKPFKFQKNVSYHAKPEVVQRLQDFIDYLTLSQLSKATQKNYIYVNTKFEEWLCNQKRRIPKTSFFWVKVFLRQRLFCGFQRPTSTLIYYQGLRYRFQVFEQKNWNFQTFRPKIRSEEITRIMPLKMLELKNEPQMIQSMKMDEDISLRGCDDEQKKSQNLDTNQVEDTATYDDIEIILNF